MSKVQGVLSKVQDPADRAALAARFGVNLGASLDPPWLGAAPHGVKGDGEINNEADLMREVAKARAELGLPPRDQVADDDAPGGLINSEETLVREVRRMRRSLGLSV